MTLGRSNSVKRTGSRGYTLLELLISMLILLTVTAVVFEQIDQMQKKSSSEAMKVDLSQQAREFVNQTVRDLHMAGYPSASMYANQPDLTQIAKGLVSVSPTQILFEGDVNNDGNVYSVNISYVANDPNDPNCPCIRRSVVQKTSADSLNEGQGASYTETDHVFPPGTGAGQSGEDLFAYYDQNGNPLNVGTGVDISTPAGVATISTIKTVKISLSMLTNLPDPATPNGFIRTSISATSRLNQ
ncbi:MAG TPA: prepilin-type N-terminal cleavage/methylation domain-containing protein [Candidatus Angelobacter sp.]|nr:prepilin-type N-terminal cleavage/methylation domain-containing protein [Candidatus Angelobacter sp.]